MVQVRAATVADVAELVRLRRILVGSAGREPGPDHEATTVRVLRDGLTAGTWAAYVVAKPECPDELAACAVGFIEQHLGSPRNPDGRVGYILNVVTDVTHRRRGYSRACMEALLGWFDALGVAVVDLRASPPGEPLYRSLGFEPPTNTALRRLRPGA